MITISQAVRETLERSPFLSELVSEGLANIRELARRIQPEIEKRLYEEVSEAAIAVALHRLAKDLQKPASGISFLKQLNDITVRSKMVEFIFPNTPELPRMLESLMHVVRDRKEVFLAFTQGLHESVVVVNKEFEQEFLTLCKDVRPKILEGLSVITMRLPESSLPVPGVYYPLLKALASEGISFTEIMSVNTEVSIVFTDADVDRAFAVLKRITS